MTIFLTSDLHVSHARICELANRPFSSVEAMDEMLAERWNSVVGPDDTVYVLGDVCMGVLSESLEKTARLAGKRFLVPGNHDRVSSLYKGSADKKAEWRKMYEDAGWIIWMEDCYIRLDGMKIRLNHFPYSGDSQGADRYAEARPIRGEMDEDLLCHGHLHSKNKKSGYRSIDVGVDSWDFYPVSWSQIAETVDLNE